MKIHRLVRETVGGKRVWKHLCGGNGIMSSTGGLLVTCKTCRRLLGMKP
jgi:hypothetical protein